MCVCMCMHICVYVCVYVYMCVCGYVCVCEECDEFINQKEYNILLNVLQCVTIRIKLNDIVK